MNKYAKKRLEILKYPEPKQNDSNCSFYVKPQASKVIKAKNRDNNSSRVSVSSKNLNY